MINDRVQTPIYLFSFMASLIVALPVDANTQQSGSDIFNSRPYLWVEAEDFDGLGADPDNNGWKVVSKTTPTISPQGRNILPANSNVSGTALLDDIGGVRHSDTVTYHLRFVTPGAYQLYTRHSLFDSAPTAGNFGAEDSIFASPAFNKNSEADWLGFQGTDYDESAGSTPAPGEPVNPQGYVPGTALHENAGWLDIRDWGVKDLGVVTFNNNAAEEFWNGQFHWYNRPFFTAVTDAGTFKDDFGFKTEYIVTPEMVGQTVTFEIGSRESYVAIDGFLFIQDNDLDLLDEHSQADLNAVLVPRLPTLRSDFDSNNSVNGADFAIWETGFATATGATKAVGDANGDASVSGEDFLLWQGEFGQTSPSVGAVSALPEPSSAALLASAIAALASGRECRRAKNLSGNVPSPRRKFATVAT